MYRTFYFPVAIIDVLPINNGTGANRQRSDAADDRAADALWMSANFRQKSPSADAGWRSKPSFTSCAAT